MRVPTVGESISEVTIGQWFKKDGDQVQLDEVLCELESDKATFEFPAEASGILRIKAKEGDTVEIGGLICTIEESATAAIPASASVPASALQQAAPLASSAAQSIKDMVVPTVGESITEVTLANWIKKDGDQVTLDEIIADVDSDKATFELPAEATGILRHVAKEGDVLEIGGLICRIEVGGKAPSASSTAAPAAPVAAPTTSSENYATGHASPAAAKILAEKGIPAATVVGTGIEGRVTKEDALTAVPAAPAASQTTAAAPVAQAAPAAVVPGARAIRREKLSSLR